jgi:hypothetical protein
MAEASGNRSNGSGFHDLGENGGRVPLADRIALDSWIAEEARRWSWAQPLARNGLAPIGAQADFARTVKTRIGDPLLEGWPGGENALRQVRQGLDALFGPGGLVHSSSARGRRVLELLEPGGDDAARRAAGALAFFAGVPSGDLAGTAAEGWQRAALIDREVRLAEQAKAYEIRITNAERELSELRQRVAVGDPLTAIADSWQRRAKHHRQRARLAMDRMLISAGAALIGAFVLLFVPGVGPIGTWFESSAREAVHTPPANGTPAKPAAATPSVASPPPAAPATPRIPERVEPPDVPFYCLFDFWPFKCTPQPTPPSTQAAIVAKPAPPPPAPPRPVVTAAPAPSSAPVAVSAPTPGPPLDPLERWGPRLVGLVVWMLIGAWLMRLFAADRRLHEALALEADERVTLATAYRALALTDPSRVERLELLGALLRPSTLPAGPAGGLDGLMGTIRRAWRAAEPS